MDEKNKLLYKLMLLYMLNKVDFSLSFSQISDFILEKGYTDYFTLQVCLSELIDSSLIHAEVIPSGCSRGISTGKSARTLISIWKRMS